MAFFFFHTSLYVYILVKWMSSVSALPKPTDLKVHVNESALTANVTWRIPTDIRIKFTYVEWQSPEGNMINYSYVDPHTSFYIINELQPCLEYTVRLSSVDGSKYSEYVRQKFAISDKKYISLVNNNVNISWKTNLNYPYQVILPTSTVLYEMSPSRKMASTISGTSKYNYNETLPKTIGITVMHVNKSDAGIYKTKEKSGYKVDGCALIIVKDKPTKPVLSSDPQHAFVGENVTFTCQSTVRRWPNYIQSCLSYTYNGVHGFRVRDRLVVTGLSHNHIDGRVTCTATDDLKQQSETSNVITLNPYYGPESVQIKPYEEMITIIEGETLGPIVCSTSCNPSCNVAWSINATRKLKTSDVKSDLTIKYIKKDQSGTYVCKAGHKYKNDRTTMKAFNVDVQYPPTIEEIYLNETPYVEGIPHKLQEAQNIDIKVSINGNPDSRVYFSRTGTNKKPVNVTRRHNFYTFHSFGLQCEDSGQYTLQAENDVKYSTNWTVELDLQCGPRNILFERSVVGTFKGAVENITLSVVANPKPSINWKPQTNYEWTLTKLGTNKYRGFSQLKISNEHSFGIYHVEILNRISSVVHNLSIDAAGKPESPKNLTLKELSHNWASFSFVAGFDGGRKQTFTIEVMPIDTTIANLIMEEIVANDTRKDVVLSHTIQDLLPSTRYNVTITATNSLGSCSTFIEITTNNEPDDSISALLTTPAVLFGAGIGIPIFIVIIVSSFLIKYKRRQNSNNVDNSDYKVQIGDMGSSYQNEGVGDEYACVSKVTKKSKGNKIETRLEENNEYAEVDKSNRIKGSITEGSKDANCDFTSEKSDGTETSQRPVRTQNADGLLYIEVDFTNPKSSKNRTPVIHGANERTDYVDIDFTRRADYSPDAEIKNNENSEHEN